MPEPTTTATTARRRDRRQLPMWSIAALAVVGGLAIGRFVTVDGGETTGAAPVTAVGTLSGGADGGIAALEAVVAERPGHAPSWRSLGTAYVARAVELGDPAYYDLAEQAFGQATDLAPGDPTTLVGRGELALSLHHFEEAARLGEQATAALPANADALGVLVDAHVELGRYDDAAIALQAMLDARPGLPALARASYLRELGGDLDGAIDAMRRALVAGSPSPFEVATVTTLLGDLERAAGDLDGARARYDDALGHLPDFVPAVLGQAHVLAAEDRHDDALALVSDLVERVPRPDALVVLAELQHVTGDLEGERETAELHRITSRLQQAAGQVVDLEAAVFEADLGDDPERAVELARAAHDARPDNVFAADALAWALLQAGDVDAAVPFAEQATRLGTADPGLRHHAAEVFAAAGDLERARAHLEVALVAGPGASIRHQAAIDALATRLSLRTPEAS